MSLNHLQAYNQEIRDWLLKVFEWTSRIPKDALVERCCPVCDSNEGGWFLNNGYLDYFRCNECNLVFQNPALNSELVNDGFAGGDRLLKDYFSISQKYKGDIPPKPDPFNDSKLKDIYAVKSSGRLLDVGCSVGDFLHKAKYFYEVEGVEINPYTAEIASRYFKVYKELLSELSLPNVYDVVTLHQILYGVPEPLSLLRDIHAILKPGGILYINTPNSDSYASRLYGGKCCHFYGYTSLNVFNPSALKALAIKAGFKVTSLRTEWLDIYATDLQEFYDHPESFIHKRNCHLMGYEERIALEDYTQGGLNLDLGLAGNYIVAILEKI